MIPAKSKKVARRLAAREYMPLIGWVACWAIVALVIGHADAARLLAATIFVRGVRFLIAANTSTPLRRRLNAPPDVMKNAVRTALIVEGITLIAAFATLSLLIWALFGLHEPKVATMCLLLSVGVPARHFLPLLRGRNFGSFFRAVVAWAGVVLAGLAWLFGGGLVAVALAIGLREWVGLAVSFFAATTKPTNNPTDEPLDWREIAAYSRGRGHRRLTYRIGKGILTAIAGPFGGIAARTGRGMRMDARVARFVPQKRSSMWLTFLGLTGVAIGMIELYPEPATFIVAASILRVAAAAGNVLIWDYVGDARDVDLDDDDED